MKYYVISTSRAGHGAIFTNKVEAQEYLKQHNGAIYAVFDQMPTKIPPKSEPLSTEPLSISTTSEIIIYTDGSALGNPGPGGYGVVISADGTGSELSGGFSHTTNNRMELMAVITALESLEGMPDRSIKVFSDSQYTLNGITKGWAKSWRLKGWIKSDGKPALNTDLWERMLNLIDMFSDLSFEWVRGHAGDPLNERADQLATGAAAGGSLMPDTGYRQ